MVADRAHAHSCLPSTMMTHQQTTGRTKRPTRMRLFCFGEELPGSEARYSVLVRCSTDGLRVGDHSAPKRKEQIRYFFAIHRIFSNRFRALGGSQKHHRIHKRQHCCIKRSWASSCPGKGACRRNCGRRTSFRWEFSRAKCPLLFFQTRLFSINSNCLAS